MKKLALFGLFTLSASSVAYAGEIAQMYQKMVGSQHPEKPTTRGQGDGNKKSGINEIGLERTRCFGTCPAYTVVIKKDGSLRYTGEAFVKNIGIRTGKIPEWQFEQLARFIKESGYLNLKNSYAVGHTDAPTTYTTVVMGSKRKLIRDYGNAGPSQLWATGQLIDKVVAEAQWDAPAAKTSKTYGTKP